MKVVMAIDDYFIGTGEGTVSDRVWFYGTYALTGVIAAFTFLN